MPTQIKILIGWLFGIGVLIFANAYMAEEVVKLTPLVYYALLLGALLKRGSGARIALFIVPILFTIVWVSSLIFSAPMLAKLGAAIWDAQFILHTAIFAMGILWNLYCVFVMCQKAGKGWMEGAAATA